MSITLWPEWQQPREKLLQQGAEYLSDGELLALIFGTGSKGKSAVALSNNMLMQFGGVAGLLNASDEELKQLVGVGPAKFCRLKAVMQLAKRYLAERAKQLPNLGTATHTIDFLQMQLQHHRREVFACLYLNAQKQAIDYKEIFMGTIDRVVVHPREIAKQALAYDASYVILAHNHPSGALQPSQADIDLTGALAKALNLLDIELLDHVIIVRGGTYSFSKAGRLPNV